VRGLWVCEIYDGWRIGWFKKKEKSFRAHIARRRRISLTEGEYRCPKGNIAARRGISLPEGEYRCPKGNIASAQAEISLHCKCNNAYQKRRCKTAP